MLVKIRRDHAKRLHKDGRLVFISMNRKAHEQVDDPPRLMNPLMDFGGQIVAYEYWNSGQGRGQRASFFTEDIDAEELP